MSLNDLMMLALLDISEEAIKKFNRYVRERAAELSISGDNTYHIVDNAFNAVEDMREEIADWATLSVYVFKRYNKNTFEEDNVVVTARSLREACIYIACEPDDVDVDHWYKPDGTWYCDVCDCAPGLIGWFSEEA